MAPDFFSSAAAPPRAAFVPSGGGGGGGGVAGGGHHHGGGGGWWGGGGWGWPYYTAAYSPYYYPAYGYYPYNYPYAYSPAYYGYQQTYSQTVPSSCCYNVETGSLYCPGSEYDGAPAFAEATRQYQGRPMSFVTSPRLGQAQWFWDCPSAAEPSAFVGGGAPSRMPRPRMPRLPLSLNPRRSRLR
jgi:hypothetical protein